MTPLTPDNTADEDEFDPRTFEALNRYLDELHSGQRPSSESVSLVDPSLGPLLDCLNVLDELSPREPPSADPRDDVATYFSGTSEGAPSEGRSSTGASSDGAPQGTATFPCEFGDYELLEELGHGGMGVVYRARQKSLDRIVALKMILASHLATADQVARFEVEARSAAGLRHPNVVGVYEVGQCHGQHYFTMEYIAGDTLAALLSQGPIPIEDGVKTLICVARAVEHLHEHGIVHRDLKPSNVIVDEAGRPSLADFGLAQVWAAGAADSPSGPIAGTPSYMAPEQADPKTAAISPATDVYGLGAIMYEMLTGRPPFRESTPLDTLLALLEREATPPRQLNADCPRGLEAICRKCLEKNPEHRYTAAAEVADELERYLTGEPLAVRPPLGVRRLSGWVTRNPALAMRVAALALFYLVQTSAFAWGASTQRFQLAMSVIVVVWLVGSVICQRVMRESTRGITARYIWSALDAACLLVALNFGSGVSSPMILGYPLLVVASGLWMQVRLVWFTTVLSLLGYSALWLVLPSLDVVRVDLSNQSVTGQILFLVTLVLLALITSYQVDRTRQLARFYERYRPQ